MLVNTKEERADWITETLGEWGFVGTTFRKESAWATIEPTVFPNGSVFVVQDFPNYIAGNFITGLGSWVLSPMRWREDKERKINSLYQDEEAIEKEYAQKWKDTTKEIVGVYRWGLGQTKTFQMRG